MKLTLEGNAFTILGRLEGMSKAEAWEQIKAGGGAVRKTLARSTDVLVMGRLLYEMDYQKNKEKAEINGTHVITPKQFATLLDKGHISLRKKKQQKAQGEADVEESIGRFRGLFDEAPTVESWQQLCDLLDQTHPDALDVVVDYVVSHLAPYQPDWDAPASHNFRNQRTHTPAFEPPEAWLHALLAGESSPKFRALKKIGIYDLGLTGKPAKALIACPMLEDVTQLKLGHNKLPHGFYKQLGATAHLAGLTHLSLKRSPIERKAALGLAANDLFQDLTHLSLEDCTFRDQGILEALFGDGAFASLESFVASGSEIGGADLGAMADATQLSGLRELHLSHCRQLDFNGVEAFLLAPHAAQLEVLDLSYHRFGEGLGVVLAEADHIRGLKRLDLYSVNCGPSDLNAIAQSPHSASLESLQLGHRELPGAALHVLFESPYLAQLKSLQLTDVNSSDALLHAVSEATHLTRLTHFTCRGTFTVEGVRAFAQAPHLAALTDAYLGDLPEACAPIIEASPYLKAEVKEDLLRYCKG